MKNHDDINHAELDELFEKYRKAPDSYVFAPLADGCRKLGRFEEALEICDAGLEHHPRYASGRVVRGKCLYDLNRADEARASFQTVLDIDEDNLVALKFLGQIEADAENYEGARDYFRHILALDPENQEISRIMLAVEERERAGLSSREASADVAEPPATERPIERETSFEAQSIDLSEGEDVETSDELASITLADIFSSQGYVDRARKIYEEVLHAQPGNQDVRRKLNALDGVLSTPPPADHDAEDEMEAATDIEDSGEALEAEEPMTDEEEIESEPIELGAPPDEAYEAVTDIEDSGDDEPTRGEAIELGVSLDDEPDDDSLEAELEAPEIEFETETIEVTVSDAVDEVIERDGFKEIGEADSKARVDATPTRTVTHTRRKKTSPTKPEHDRKLKDEDSMRHFRRWLNHVAE